MRKVVAFAEAAVAPAKAQSSELVLPFDTRKKSRFKAQASSGEALAVMLPRGRILRGGDCLVDEDGGFVGVVAAPEAVSRAASTDPRLLARAAYHLGNRHVPLQIGAGWLCYQHDHVLDAMVRGLGLAVSAEQAPFEPEAGAYSASDSGARHDHSH